MAIKFEDLSEEQIICLWNGVGSDTIPIKPFQLVFGKASIKHDFEYYCGGEESDRLKADKEFLYNCLTAAGSNLYYKFMAYVYYYALRLLGNKGAFEFGPKAETWEEIFDRIKKSRLTAYNVDRLKRTINNKPTKTSSSLYIRLKNSIKSF